jgi:hypothetical protein
MIPLGRKPLAAAAAAAMVPKNPRLDTFVIQSSVRNKHLGVLRSQYSPMGFLNGVLPVAVAPQSRQTFETLFADRSKTLDQQDRFFACRVRP